MMHYTKEDLEMYRDHKMTVLGRMACSAHLKMCPECSKRLQELAEDDDLLRRLRGSILDYREILQKHAGERVRAETKSLYSSK